MKIKHFRAYLIAGIVAIVTLIITVSILAAPTFAKGKTNNEIKRAVPFSEVNVTDGFMRDYIKLVICQVIPTAIENVKKPKGGLDNIINCAKWHEQGSDPEKRPAPEGERYVDSDVHKVLESMCMALDIPDDGDEEIQKAQSSIHEILEDWIDSYEHAPELGEDNPYKGYFDTVYSLSPGYTKYSNVDNHELYCQGHFIEAAVAHYRYSKHREAKPDDRLLKVAINSANHIAATFGNGEGKLKQIPGHEEIELALIKLAKLCREIGGDYEKYVDTYINTAEFFLQVRGDYEGRTADIPDDKRQYYQDHLPVSQQMDAVGHAVRAQYLYTGMCELATERSEYEEIYDKALTSLWDSVTNKKQYITGGIGDESNNNEGFAGDYFLPNYQSYCETCAGVANMLWNRSMSTLYDGSKYADQIETDLYNNVLGCVNFDGNKFYYQNKINSLNGFDRSDWFGTACCPPNFTRTVLQAGGYVYNTTSNDVYVNQYITNKGKFNLNSSKTACLVMKSDFPYSSTGIITVTPESKGTFNIHLRKPSWSNGYSIKVDGKSITPQEKDGYLVIDSSEFSTNNSQIEFNFDMQLQYIKTDQHIEANQGLLALRHGPIIYCAEACDNEANLNIAKSSVDPNGQYNFEQVELSDGKDNHYGVRSVYVLNHTGKYAAPDGIKDVTWRFIPYYARCNRSVGPMQVYVFDGSNPLKTHLRANAAASFSADRGPSALNDGINDEYLRWSNYGNDTPNPWVWYDFDTPVKFKGFRIWWYTSNSVRPADHFEFSVYNKQTGEIKSINVNDNNLVNTNNDDKYKVYDFGQTFEGDAIKMTLYNTYEQGQMKYVGINEWELIDSNDPVPPTPDPPTPDPSYNNYDYVNAATGDNLLLAILVLATLATAIGLTLKYRNYFRK